MVNFFFLENKKISTNVDVEIFCKNDKKPKTFFFDEKFKSVKCQYDNALFNFYKKDDYTSSKF